MSAPLCSTLRGVAFRQLQVRMRELLPPRFVEMCDRATLGAVSTAVIALVSAAALAFLGGA